MHRTKRRRYKVHGDRFIRQGTISLNELIHHCEVLYFSLQILVDVPCTTDRLSVNEDDNNIFKSTRIKERLKIPEAQASILTHCLELLKPGGSLIYSTCSLSPVQNDGVVHMALSKAFSELHITATVK